MNIIEELREPEIIRFPKSKTSAESIHIVKTLAENRKKKIHSVYHNRKLNFFKKFFINLLKFVRAEINHVETEIDSAFLARRIDNN